MTNGTPQTAQVQPAKPPEKPASPLAIIKTNLLSEDTVSHFTNCLPSAKGKHGREVAARFVRMVYTAVCQSNDLQKCSFTSLLKAASIAATLDLDIDPRGLAYLVPYKGEANFQIGYQGLIELAYRSGKVKAIAAHCIYESEKASVKIIRVNGGFTVEHPFSFEPPTGKVIAAYATAEIEGLPPQTCVLRISEIERLRKCSKCPNSPAWANHYEAMCKKTVVRQLAKFLPKSILDEFSRAAAEDEEQDFSQAAETAQAKITGDMGTNVVDAAFEQAPALPSTEPPKQSCDFMSNEGLE